MTLTRRGRIVTAAIVLAFAWGYAFGVQALNVLILPGVVGLVAAWLFVSGAEEPSVDRAPIDAAFPGEARLVQLYITHPAALTVEAQDHLPDDVTVTDGSADRPVVDEHVAYEMAATSRGVSHVGPVTVRYEDPLGLYRRTFDTEQTSEVVTFPEIHQLDWRAAHSALLSEGSPTRERHVFDQLREYDPGDPLRDIHWRSSAKRPEHDFIVKEFVDDTETGAIRIVGESDEGRADELANAVASLALWLLDAGVPVGVELQDTDVPVAGGSPQRHRILHALARTDGGRVDPEMARSAPIVVEAENGRPLTVEVGGQAIEFEQVRAADGSTDPRRLAADGGKSR